MSARNVSYSLIRLLAVWLFANSVLPTIVSFAITLNNANTNDYQAQVTVSWVIMTAFYLLVTGGLWFGADKISNSITRKEDGSIKEDTFIYSEKILINTGLVLIGFYLIVIKIPPLLTSILAYYQIMEFSHSPMEFKIVVDIISNIAGIILGIIMILGKRRIYDIISKLRSAGTEKTQES